MNWRLITKDKNKQPNSGTYSDWKEQIAEECFFQCIYCCIHESQFGGIDHYHIEHYKPKSIERFKPLENDITNLYYACPICNRFKSNDWPNDEYDLDQICYPDPSKHDYSELFVLDFDTYKLKGKFVSTRYMTERLYLNRTQLIYERRELVLRKKESLLFSEIQALMSKEKVDNSKELTKRILNVSLNLQETLRKRYKIRPYKLSDIRR